MVSKFARESQESLVAVIGASGFLGRWVFKKAKERFGTDRVLGVYFSKKIEEDYVDFEEFVSKYLSKVRTLIITAGNSNHALPHQDFEKTYLMETRYLGRIFTSGFHGHIVYLSSAAVYYGSKGIVREQQVYPVKDEYGLAKLLAEHSLRCYVRMSASKAIVYRLMYAYGDGERPTRLLAMVKKSIKTGEVLRVYGTGTSYVNPLPAWFVAEILVRSTELVETQTVDFDIFNLAHEQPLRVIDIVDHMKERYALRYELCDPESYPVDFYVDVSKLRAILSKMGLAFPNVWEEITKYVERGGEGHEK
ncbi:NAD-dependent epimerase/dehydratase family protein [Pseudothermotoga sp.]